MVTNGLSPLEARKQLLGRELERFLAYLKAQDPPPEKVILFGSYARETEDEWADIDVVIVQRTELPFIQRTRSLLEDFDPEVGMDILVYTPEEFAALVEERPFFRDEILAKGRVLYER